MDYFFNASFFKNVKSNQTISSRFEALPSPSHLPLYNRKTYSPSPFLLSFPLAPTANLLPSSSTASLAPCGLLL
jgi:hypothetical protein